MFCIQKHCSYDIYQTMTKLPKLLYFASSVCVRMYPSLAKMKNTQITYKTNRI
uniref:Uncharacterized protein n=1 Tax=Anguilla anguilla TaxID=7936 RepID=A0A0E9U6F2_ANGAN